MVAAPPSSCIGVVLYRKPKLFFVGRKLRFIHSHRKSDRDKEWFLWTNLFNYTPSLPPPLPFPCICSSPQADTEKATNNGEEGCIRNQAALVVAGACRAQNVGGSLSSEGKGKKRARFVGNAASSEAANIHTILFWCIECIIGINHKAALWHALAIHSS